MSVFLNTKDEAVPRKEKRQYKKRKHKAGTSVCGAGTGTGSRAGLDGYLGTQGSSEEDTSSTGMRTVSPVQAAPETEDEDEGPFAFRRNPACNYHAVRVIVKLMSLTKTLLLFLHNVIILLFPSLFLENLATGHGVVRKKVVQLIEGIDIV